MKMKHSRSLITVILTALLVLSSCKQAEETGRLTFGLELEDAGLQKAALSYDHLTSALVTIKGEDGNLVYDKEAIELFWFGSGLVTRSLKLPVGGFILSEFMLLDSAGMVLWATPRQGSELAPLVREALPRHFKINSDESTSIDIQVVRIGNHPPEAFGYVQFNIDFVERFCLKVFFDTQMLDCWADSIIGPDGVVRPNFQSRLKVYAYDRLVLDEPMQAGLNRYELPLSRRYLLTASGCNGNPIFKQDFSMDELSQFGCKPENPSLVIGPEIDPDIVITPEKLYEPEITQGIFGQILSPLDKFMHSPRSDINPWINDIHLFPYHVLDSIYTFAPVNCYIHPDMLPMEALAKVRSNSEGFFQIELEEGEYLFLVKTDEGYFMDIHFSSHQPGYVKVYPGEVSELAINLMDCSMWQ